MKFCPVELILESLTRICEWHQNFSEYIAVRQSHCKPLNLVYPHQTEANTSWYLLSIDVYDLISLP